MLHLEQTYTTFFLYAGSGGAAIGMQQAVAEFRGIRGRFEVLGGVDSDPACVEDFTNLTGVPATQMDLFDRDQYRKWHGKGPPEDWNEVGPDDLRRAAQGRNPDVVVITAPCKGFSGLLSQEKSDSSRYQALNRLTERGLFLTLETWRDHRPLILFENVPRISTRGKKFLGQIKQLLKAYGYQWHESHHDCGDIGGLAQHRKRYLLIARHPARLASVVYHPPKQRVRTIGEVIGPLAMPDAPECGPMHRLPRLQWKTWLRLAMIPPGGDWRDLEKAAGQYRIVPHPGKHNMKYRVQRMDAPAATVIGTPDVQAGAPIVADHRQAHMDDDKTFPHKYQVVRMDEPGPTVTGSRLGSGAPAIADMRLNHTPMGSGKGAYHVQRFDEPNGTITGDPDHRKSGGNGTVADPRKEYYGNMLRVAGFEEPAQTVTGAAGPNQGAGLVADPRLSQHGQNYAGSPGLMGVSDWDQPSKAVTGSASVTSSNMPAAIADPRLDCKPRNGAYGVQDWDQPGSTVIGSGDIHAGAAAVADPRGADHIAGADKMIPADTDRGVWVIISPWNCWHRPLTTYELAALQGFPLTMPDGSPLKLAGTSDRSHRERIGNAVPPPTMRAIGEQMLLSLIPSEEGIWRPDVLQTGTWVQPEVRDDASSAD